MEYMNITAIRTNGSPITQQFDYDGTSANDHIVNALEVWNDNTTAYGGIIRVFINLPDWTAEFETVRHAVGYILSDGYGYIDGPTPTCEWTVRTSTHNTARCSCTAFGRSHGLRKRTI